MKLFGKVIGEIKSPIYGDVHADEKFQKIFFQVFESIEKTPAVIKNIYLSNIAHRVFSHNVHQSIDEKTASFFKEIVRTPLTKYYTPLNTIVEVELDEKLLQRSRGIGIHTGNYASNDICEVHITPTNAYYDDLFYYEVPAGKTKLFEFENYCPLLHIYLKNHGTNGPYTSVIISYLPI